MQNTTTKENESLMAIGTAYVQGEDVAARGRVLLFSFAKTNESSQNLVKKKKKNRNAFCDWLSNFLFSLFAVLHTSGSHLFCFPL